MTTAQATTSGSSGPEAALLRLNDLAKHFPTKRVSIGRGKGAVRAVDGIDLWVERGETLGLVGESGCGKSTAARTMIRAYDPTHGSIEFDGRDITTVRGSQLRRLRREMQLVFQDPYSSLNPRQTVGAALSAPFEIQHIATPTGTRAAVHELLERVGLSPEHYNRYPHEFSGGQRQRIGIARALSMSPKLIVCDEPVSALDVSVQAQIINLLENVQREHGIAYVFVAHDLSVVRHISSRIAVMYLGKVMECAPTDELHDQPLHPYTRALLSASPLADPDAQRQRERMILQGDLPSPSNPPSGCVFRTRCPLATDRCAAEVPEYRELVPGRFVACHYPADVSDDHSEPHLRARAITPEQP